VDHGICWHDGQVTERATQRRDRTVSAVLVVAFVAVLLVSVGAALSTAMPVWSAYCLPKSDGALGLVLGLSSRDIVTEESSCLWPQAEVVWRGPDGTDQTVSLSADWRFVSPLLVLLAGGAVLLWRRRTGTRHATEPALASPV
jgi:hypothetical protein